MSELTTRYFRPGWSRTGLSLSLMCMVLIGLLSGCGMGGANAASTRLEAAKAYCRNLDPGAYAGADVGTMTRITPAAVQAEKADGQRFLGGSDTHTLGALILDIANLGPTKQWHDRDSALFLRYVRDEITPCKKITSKVSS